MIPFVPEILLLEVYAIMWETVPSVGNVPQPPLRKASGE